MLDSNTINALIFYLALASIFGLGAAAMYVFLLVNFAWVHFENGHSVCESLKLAANELQ